MQFPRQCKIYKACAKEPVSRFMTDAAMVDKTEPEKPVLVATNGKMLAVVNVEDADDTEEGALFPSGLLAEAIRGSSGYKAPWLSASKTELQVLGKTGMIRSQVDDVHESDRKFPDWRHVVPTTEPTVTIALDTKFLAALAEAIGTVSVALEIHDDKTPITVRPILECADRGNYGVLMPIT